eukprot:TRINITY_DN2728_c0_g1_i2.p1 TRINITY_DN2728_c0_g1~~TRINITY_DN2728_c0_g1_i2.p1  ORF type:complete len:182 (+),score=56.87 TRINITY_DN2728_c0_g1_i2:302-847(+)
MVVEVPYCGVCTLPVEYCEFGPSPPKCKQWCVDNVPKDKWPKEYASEGDVEKKLEGLSVGGSSSSSSSSSSAEPVKMLPGGKIKKKESATVTICTTSRNKRKYVTTVAGLEKFGIKLADAAKLFGKRFACGASVVKNPQDKEEIDIQGDVADDLLDYIVEKYGEQVPEDCIQIIEDKKKKK